jgi:septal ring factor EnvC (AmiA/AmiB activator)
MKTDLEARRRQLVREIAQVDRAIAQTKKRLAHLEAQIALANSVKNQAA